MKLIIPMAGMGKRMRPHTLTVPKPLLPIAGQPIVYRLVEELVKVSKTPITEIGFVVGDFGHEVESKLIGIAEKFGAKGHIFHQKEALGTAHAIHCAQKLMRGPAIVAFADTLFKAAFVLDESADGIIWVKKVDQPNQFGVVQLNDNQEIIDFVEKPSVFVSDLAIIGIYYFKDSGVLLQELQYLLDNKMMVKGEYQLTDALENMRKKGQVFKPGEVKEWLDCGNKDATVFTNQRILEHLFTDKQLNTAAYSDDVKIIPPCFIGENVNLKGSEIGPFVSIGNNTTIVNSKIKNAIIQENTTIVDSYFENSMIGNFVEYKGSNTCHEVSIGDYSVVNERING